MQWRRTEGDTTEVEGWRSMFDIEQQNVNYDYWRELNIPWQDFSKIMGTLQTQTGHVIFGWSILKQGWTAFERGGSQVKLNLRSVREILYLRGGSSFHRSVICLWQMSPQLECVGWADKRSWLEDWVQLAAWLLRGGGM